MTYLGKSDLVFLVRPPLASIHNRQGYCLFYHTVWLCTPLHCPALNCPALHCSALYCTALHWTALHCTSLHCTALLCSALLCTALHCTALHWTALHCPALLCTALLCNVLFCTALNCCVLHCSALHCSAPFVRFSVGKTVNSCRASGCLWIVSPSVRTALCHKRALLAAIWDSMDWELKYQLPINDPSLWSS